jgi:UDP-N-acetylmuramyl pentapeptide phosphotransferase/UDP-N-acetylglucosamine-1-phosphate transferase
MRIAYGHPGMYLCSGSSPAPSGQRSITKPQINVPQESLNLLGRPLEEADANDLKGGGQMNYLAVLVSAIVNMVIGGLWYSPLLFAKQWMEFNNMTPESMKGINPGPLYAQSFAATLVSYFILAMAINSLNITTAMDGLKTGFCVWLGFITTVQFTANVFSPKKIQAYFIDTGYQLVSILSAGALLAVWR